MDRFFGHTGDMTKGWREQSEIEGNAYIFWLSPYPLSSEGIVSDIAVASVPRILPFVRIRKLRFIWQRNSEFHG